MPFPRFRSSVIVPGHAGCTSTPPLPPLGHGNHMPKALSDPRERRLMGERIRKVRLSVGLRQWQLAELVGTSQPSICMYERGVLPDPLRLLRIARIGKTTVEWLLTGRHWEGGSEEMEIASEDLYELAALFHGVSEADRTSLLAAGQFLRKLVAAIEAESGAPIEAASMDTIVRAIRLLPPADRRSLCGALAAGAGVSRALLCRGLRSMEASSLASATHRSNPGGDSPPPPARFRTLTLDRVSGNLFRLDPGLLLLGEILRDRRLREDFERSVSGMARKLESRRRVPSA